MNKKTFQIIMACKGQFDILRLKVRENPKDLTPIERVKLFKTITGKAPNNYYTAVSASLKGVLFDAMCNYLQTCDNAGAFIRSLQEIRDKMNLPEEECIAYAFELVQVKNNVEYINGFKEYFNDAIVGAEQAKCVSAFIKNTAEVLNVLKDYEVAPTQGRSGKMIVHYKNVNYLIDVQALDYNTLESDMKTYAQSL